LCITFRLHHLRDDVKNYHIRYMKNARSPAAAVPKNGVNVVDVGVGSTKPSSASNGQQQDSSGANCTLNNASLPKGWERGNTEENIPYYLNHADESTQWDHPKYTGTRKMLKH
jgi:hypothetical protein